MIPNFIRTIPKLALAALFAVAAGGAVIASDVPSADAQVVIRDRFPNGYVDVNFHGGYWHGQRWHHRRWVGGFYGPYHHWHPGHWVYF